MSDLNKIVICGFCQQDVINCQCHIKYNNQTELDMTRRDHNEIVGKLDRIIELLEGMQKQSAVIPQDVMQLSATVEIEEPEEDKSILLDPAIYKVICDNCNGLCDCVKYYGIDEDLPEKDRRLFGHCKKCTYITIGDQR